VQFGRRCYSVLDSLVSRHVHVTGSGSQNAHCGDIRQQIERSAHVIVTDSSLCRTRQPAWSPGLIATTTPRRFLLACTGCQCASESSTRRRCLRGSACTMQPLAVWLTCVCRPTLCIVASNYVSLRLGLCWSRAPGLLPVSAASPSMDHEHGTVCQPILEHQIRLSAASSVISRPTCFSTQQ